MYQPPHHAPPFFPSAPSLTMPFGFLPPAVPPPMMPVPAPPSSSSPGMFYPQPSSAPLLPFPTAIPATAPSTDSSSSQQYGGARGGKRPYGAGAAASGSYDSSKYARTGDDSSSSYRGRGRGRGGSAMRGRGGSRGGGTAPQNTGAPALPEHLNKYLLAPAAPINNLRVAANSSQQPAERYSTALGHAIIVPSSASAASAKPKAPVYCQKFMSNLCTLRSCDATEDTDDEEVNDESDQAASASAAIPSSRTHRCEFLHDIEFRRAYLAKSHYTHTRYTQSHPDRDESSSSSSSRGGWRGKGRDHAAQKSSGKDGQLAGLRAPTTESALLRKLLVSSEVTESSRLLQAIRYLVSNDFLAKQRQEKEEIQRKAEEEYRRQKAENLENERKEESMTETKQDS